MATPSTDTQASSRSTFVLSAPVPRVLWSLSWPMTIGLFSVIAFNVVDTLYIGQLGAEPLAAMGFCLPVIFGMSAIAIGFGNGATSIVSRRLGAGEQQAARDLVFNTMIFVLGYSIALAVLMALVSEPIFRLLGASDALMPVIHQYMDVWYLGLPFLIMPIVLNGLIRATGEAVVPSALMVVAAVINAVLSPILIFGLLGSPAIGMAGAAWATIVARGAITVVAFYYLIRVGTMGVSLRALSHFWACVREMLAYGLPAFIGQLVSPLAMFAIIRLLSGAGNDAVAAYTVGARIEALALVPFFALQMGVGPFIGQNVGAGQTARLRAAERTVIQFCFGWGLVAGIILFAFGGDLAGFFSNDPAIVALADRYLAFVATGLWGAGLMVVSVGIFNPLGYPKLGMGVSALRYLALYAGGAYLIAMLIGGTLSAPAPVPGVFTAAPLSYIISGVIGLLLIHRLLDRPKDPNARSAKDPTPPTAREDQPPHQHPTGAAGASP